MDDSAQERLEYRLARRMDYDENDFLFDRFPDDEDDDNENLLRIVDNFIQP